MDLQPPPESFEDLDQAQEYLQTMYNWLKYPGEFNCQKLLVGDGGTTNYTQFAADGELTQAGTARTTKYSWLSAGAVRSVGANPATVTVNPIGFLILEFADAADDYAQTNIKLPADIDLTEAMYICLGWSVPNTSANMTWGWGYLVTAADEDTEAAATTGVTVVTSSSVADGLNVDTIVTIAADTVGASDVCLHLYFYRDVSADTYGANVDVHGVTLMYTAKQLGTAT